MGDESIIITISMDEEMDFSDNNRNIDTSGSWRKVSDDNNIRVYTISFYGESYNIEYYKAGAYSGERKEILILKNYHGSDIRLSRFI